MKKKSKGLGRRKTAPPEGEDRRSRWKFGQNFLVDSAVIRQIAEDVPLSPRDWVIEIGPGQGAITRQLAGRCAKLTAVEIDPKWADHVEKHPEWGNVEVIRADATRVDVEALLSEHAPSPDARPVLVGNLPYNRAAPILFRFLPHASRFKSMHVMVQYEVGKRLSAKPHSRDFGFLSVFVQNLAAAELVRKIGPDAFRPRPKVLSATVKLEPLPGPQVNDPAFLTFAELCFTQKRKKLTNVLGPFYPKAKVLEALQGLGSGIDSRAEDLSVPDFASLFKTLGPPAGVPARRAPGSVPEDLDLDEDEQALGEEEGEGER
jgi:16S rRNA (adenine1518-N6/adenine1519-N6)-dimethyltransferase